MLYPKACLGSRVVWSEVRAKRASHGSREREERLACVIVVCGEHDDLWCLRGGIAELAVQGIHTSELIGLGRRVQQDIQISQTIDRHTFFDAILCVHAELRRKNAREARRALHQRTLDGLRQGFPQYLSPQTVADRDKPHEWLFLLRGAGIHAKVDPLQPLDELGDIAFTNAFGRVLSTPDRRVVRQARQGATAPTHIDADQLEVCCPGKLLAQGGAMWVRQDGFQGRHRGLGIHQVLVGLLGIVVPTVDEHDHKYICGFA